MDKLVKTPWYKSIIFKFLLLFLASAFLIQQSFRWVLFQSFDDYAQQLGHANLKKYAELLINDIKNNYGPSTYYKLAEEIGIHFSIVDPAGNWQAKSKRDLPECSSMNGTWRSRRPDMDFGRHQNHFFIKIPSAPYQACFFTASKNLGGIRQGPLVTGILIIFIIFAGAFGLARRWLRSVKDLETAMLTVANDGDSFTQLTPQSQDEFSNLLRAYNFMADKISRLIKSKEQLLLDVSHELRTPLTRIKLATSLLPDTEKKESINEDLNELNELINKILTADNEAIASGIIEVDLVATINEVIKDFNIYDKVRVDKAREKHVVKIEKDDLRSILRNLIDNTIKYQNPLRDLKVKISIQENDSGTVLTVKDNGQGISNSDLSRVMDSFYRGDKSRNKDIPGYGLGLDICNRLMVKHKGRIHIDSKLDEYTELTLHFPK